MNSDTTKWSRSVWGNTADEICMAAARQLDLDLIEWEPVAISGVTKEELGKKFYPLARKRVDGSWLFARWPWGIEPRHRCFAVVGFVKKHVIERDGYYDYPF